MSRSPPPRSQRPPQEAASTPEAGAAFSHIDDVARFLKQKGVLGENQTVSAHSAQSATLRHRAYVLLTEEGGCLRQIVLVKTFPDRPPLIAPFPQPKAVVLEAHEDQGASRLVLRAERTYEVSGLPPGDARRLADLVRLARHKPHNGSGLPSADAGSSIETEKNGASMTEPDAVLPVLSGLELATRVLADLGIRSGPGPTQYFVAHAGAYRYVIVHGRAYPFDKDGRAVDARSLQPRSLTDGQSGEPG